MSTEAPPRYEATDVKPMARGRWQEIFRALAHVEFPEGKKEGPCPLVGCGGSTRCRFTNRDNDGSVYCSHCMDNCGDGFAVLMRVLGKSFPEVVQQVGEYIGATPVPTRKLDKAKESREPAPLDVRDKVYRSILAGLKLSDDHRQNLRDRGLSDSTIDLEVYRTLSKATGEDRTACAAATAGLNGSANRIPGVVDGRLYARDGILIPVRNLAGQIIALKVRKDEVKPGENRYAYVSSPECSCGSPVHVPKDAADRHSRIRATEGELKATIATELSGLPTITAGSVSNWKKLEPVLREMGASTVVLAFDADSATNDKVAKQLAAAHDGLTAGGFNVELETWDPGQGKGIDDLLLAGGKPTILTDVGAAAWLDKITGREPTTEVCTPDLQTDGPAFDESEAPAEYEASELAELLWPAAVDTVSAVVKPLSLQEKPGKVTYKTVTAAELARNKYTIEYLIEDCLVAMQPLVLAGGKKCLKTNNMLDAAISLVSGKPFLQRFKVNRRVNVGVMSGESGIATIQETCLRICAAKGLDLATDCEGLFFSEDLPRIGDADHNEALGQWITDLQLGVIVIDPAYLAMPADDNGNLFAQGELLRQLTTICGNAGAGIIIAHHTKKKPADPWQPAELEDIAWSGWQEFARQWWLLSRQCKYDPERCGHHELWLNIGGSAGHSSLWGVTIDEGSRKDPGGRKWEVEVITATESRKQAEQDGEAKKLERAQAKESSKVDAARKFIEAAFRHLPDNRGTERDIKTAAGCKGVPFEQAMAAMLREKRIEPCEITKGNKQTYPGFVFKFSDKGEGQ